MPKAIIKRKSRPEPAAGITHPLPASNGRTQAVAVESETPSAHAAAPASAPLPGSSGLKGELMAWHANLSRVCGGLVLAYGKTGVKRSDLHDWSQTLHQMAKSMEKHL
jgi:hypothetical protein